MSSINEMRIKCARENYAGRTVAIYGTGNNLSKIQEKIAEFTKDIILIDTYRYNNKTIFSPQILEGLSGQYYVVVSILKHQPEIFELLEQYGYTEKKDYSYFAPELQEISDDYEDAYGNKVIGKLAGAKVKFMGHDSTIHVGKGFRGKELEIVIDSNASLVIGERAAVHKKARWILHDDSKLKIGSDTRIIQEGTEIYCHENSVCDIGNHSSFMNVHFFIRPDTQCVIGNDAMFARNVTIRTNDAHPIYDLNAGGCINDARHLKRAVVLGEHVWVGEEVYILYNTVMGNGSIIGARSLVKGKFPNNCIIAGVPAKVIRKDVAWSRKDLPNGLFDLPEEYRNFTEVETVE